MRLFQRLVGLETEYALRYHPRQACTRRPANATLFERLLVKVRGKVSAVRSSLLPHEWFLANGGAVRFERIPFLARPEAGVVEGATPECRGPRQLLRSQRAQDLLLSRAAAADDVNGQLTLLKHNRDSRGNFYGTHENYELVLASGVRLGLWRLAIALLTPVVLVLFIAVLLAFFLELALGRLIFAGAEAWRASFRKDGEGRFAALRQAGLIWLRILVLPLMLSVVLGIERPQTWPLVVAVWMVVGLVLAGVIGLGLLLALAVGRPGSANGEERLAALRETGLRWLIFLKSLPLTLLWLLFLQPLACRRCRRQLLAFLVSRPIMAGAGTVEPDGRFGLSPRAPAITAVNSITTSCFRPVYYFAHIFKQLVYLLAGDVAAYGQLFRRRQRLQITVGDANMAQTAEYLKIGTTLLVLDAIEAGALAEAPRLRRPLRALRAFCADPDLRARVRLTNGQSWTALAIQRFYLDACRRFVDQSAAPHREAEEVLRLWEETLDALAHDPDRLIGKLDWVTKRYLLDALGPQASVAEKRKLDLRYHELSRDGYYLRLEAAGAAPTVVEPEEVLQAIEEPPAGTPATLRGQLIREFAHSPEHVRASWHSVSIKDGPRTRVVKLS